MTILSVLRSLWLCSALGECTKSSLRREKQEQRETAWFENLLVKEDYFFQSEWARQSESLIEFLYWIFIRQCPIWESELYWLRWEILSWKGHLQHLISGAESLAGIWKLAVTFTLDKSVEISIFIQRGNYFKPCVSIIPELIITSQTNAFRLSYFVWQAVFVLGVNGKLGLFYLFIYFNF